jgi:hemerythrin-like metal-binding protein
MEWKLRRLGSKPARHGCSVTRGKIIMKRIIWNQRFSVGNTKLDEQHKELARIINCLIENQDAGANSEPIAEVLERMTRYAAYHFQTEERLMMEHDYPDYSSHQMDHTEFKAKTAGFCVDAVRHKEALAREVLLYLKNWLMNHILKSDMKYKLFFNERGLR